MKVEFDIYDRNNKDREKIYKLWYRVYFLEMNRNQEYANHENKTIRDGLEKSSNIITVVNPDSKEIVGTSRVNVFNYDHPEELNYYSDLYKLNQFKPEQVCIVTRYMLLKEYRDKKVGFNLALATVKYCQENSIKWIVMDCSPNLYDYFDGIGFISHLGIHHHPEYGEVKIMKFDVTQKNLNPLSDVKNLENIKFIN